jgi:hypothetical protein
LFSTPEARGDRTAAEKTFAAGVTLMTDLAVSALTNAILAAEIFFLAGLSFRVGLERWSAAWLFALYLAFIGLANLLGTIDHGFLEPIEHPANIPVRTATRSVIALATFTLLMCTARQFFGPLGTRIALGAGLVGLVATVWVMVTEDNFLVLVAGNFVVMVLTLGLHLWGLRRGSGSLMLCAGIVASIAASLIIPFGGDGWRPLGLYGTFHIALLGASFILYLGGRELKAHAG